jgi:3-hydroxyisobutyrate dehydrogenase-like beta-hydroxyacid dehydrogenase
MTQPAIGFIGLGMMGQGMARNLLRKGFVVRVMAHRNRAAAKRLVADGASEVASREALAAGAEAVIVCVTGSPEVDDVVFGADGLLAAAPRGLLVIDCTTAEPAAAARVRGALADRGCAYVDAPLARTPKEAEEGRLNAMVGATPADFARAQPILAAFCENVIHVGPPGHGHVLKLVNNMLARTMAAAIAEALAAAARSGLSLARVFEVVSAGGVNSGIFRMMVGPMLEGDLTGLKFAIANGQKDLRYFTHLAETLPTTAHLAEAAHQSFVQAANLGLGERFIASLFEAQEKLNNVSIVPR